MIVRAWMSMGLKIGAVLCGIGVVACEDEPIAATPDIEVCLVRRDGTTRYCIDVYEAARADSSDADPGVDEAKPPVSRPLRRPWTQVTWQAARSLCGARRGRLCERDEWIDACDGQPGESEGTKYTYGNEIVAGRCNTDGTGVVASGSLSECKSQVQTFDQSGNVGEWTGNNASQAAVRGGTWRSSLTHECKSGDTTQIIRPEESSPEVGFRCCRDG